MNAPTPYNYFIREIQAAARNVEGLRILIETAPHDVEREYWRDALADEIGRKTWTEAIAERDEVKR